MIKRFFFLVLAVVAFFASCTNDEQSLRVKSTTELLSVQKPELAANSNNPYDYFGKAHYDGLLFVSQKTNGFTVSRKKQKAAIDEFVKTQTFADTRSGAFSALTENELASIFEQAQNAKIQVDTVNMSAAMVNAVTLYSQTLRHLFETEGNLTFSEIKDSIMHFESYVLSNDKLTEVEKEDLLKSTSTFRYSALQWERFVKEHESKLATRSGKKWYHWVVIAGADAIGALVDKTVSGAVLASKTASDEITKELSKVEEPTKVEESKPEVDSENLE